MYSRYNLISIVLLFSLSVEVLQFVPVPWVAANDLLDLELEKFLFDLNGYLIIEDVLSKDETRRSGHE